MRLDLEELLAQMGETSEERISEPPPSDHLSRWKEGLLGERDSARLEEILAINPNARRRVVQKAGLGIPQPPAAVRTRVLDEYCALATRRRRFLPLAAVASAATVVLAVGLWWNVGPQSAPPDIFSLNPVAGAIRQVRGGGAQAADAHQTVRARPDMRLTIPVVSPSSPIPGGLEYAAYRKMEEGWERVEESTVRSDPFGAEIEAQAADLAGSRRPGVYRIEVLVGWKGRLPRRIAGVQGELKRSEWRDRHGLTWGGRLSLVLEPAS